MGLIRFWVPADERLADWPDVQRGYLTGADGRIFPTRIERDGPQIGCRRASSESCKFHVAYPVEGFGRPVLNTASLPEREQPYLLPVELARGKIVQIRNQSATWELAGMQLPDEVHAALSRAQRAFAKAASSQQEPEQACTLAHEALVHACEAADLVSTAYARQALAGRQHRYPHLPASLGCVLEGETLPPEQSDLFAATFNAVALPVRWTQIELEEGEYDWGPLDRQLAWAEERKLLVRGGPLVDLAAGGLPEWLARWSHDIFNLQSFVCDFVETAMTRYQGRIRLWEVASRFNVGGALQLSEENRLSLAARVLDVARQVDEEAQLMVRVDQPWGEYMARGQHRLSPLQLIDALIRSGVTLAGINLEIALGYQPRGSQHRDLLEFSKLIDLWSILGVPLFVTLACPSSLEADPQSAVESEIDRHMWPQPCDEPGQAKWVERFLPLLLAKPAVAGVYWSHFSDGQPHEFAHAGLLRPDGAPKPALEVLLNYHGRS